MGHELGLEHQASREHLEAEIAAAGIAVRHARVVRGRGSSGVRRVEIRLHAVEAPAERDPGQRRIERVDAELQLLGAHVPGLGDVLARQGIELRCHLDRYRRCLAVHDGKQTKRRDDEIDPVSPEFLGVAGELTEAERILEADVLNDSRLVLRARIHPGVPVVGPAEEVLLELRPTVRVHDLQRIRQRVDVARVDARIAQIPVAECPPAQLHLAPHDLHAALDGPL